MDDKIQEAYEKMLNEKATFKYMGKANDAMADFLEELENKLPGKDYPNSKKQIQLFDNIERDWETLWDDIVNLARKL